MIFASRGKRVAKAAAVFAAAASLTVLCAGESYASGTATISRTLTLTNQPTPGMAPAKMDRSIVLSQGNYLWYYGVYPASDDYISAGAPIYLDAGTYDWSCTLTPEYNYYTYSCTLALPGHTPATWKENVTDIDSYGSYIMFSDLTPN